jgi:single-strand DNA-binding protein
MARSLNKVELIGNLTRDPELRYTPSGAGVCTFGLATNRQWNTDSGEKKEDVEFHKIVAWNKLAELCSQLLAKGRKIYVEGRLQTRKWAGQDGVERTTTEIVINDMIILDSKGATSGGDDFDIPDDSLDVAGLPDEQSAPVKTQTGSKVKADDAGKKTKAKTDTAVGDESGEDIPF